MGSTGQRRSTFDSKTSAERWLTLTEAEIIQGDWIDPDAGRVLFGKYASDWIEERPGLRPKTTELYRYLLRRHLSPTFDARPLAEIREPHVRRWRKDLLDARGERGDRRQGVPAAQGDLQHGGGRRADPP